MSHYRPGIVVRNTRVEDFPGITQLTREVYPGSPPWSETQLASHLLVFPEGQLVAEEVATGAVAGMAASLILLWDDYDKEMNWKEFTDNGMFTNHDPEGRTLYGAEVMVKPFMQRRGIGRKIYQARRALAERLGLLRIRAGARLRGYHRYEQRMPVEEYVRRVAAGKLHDPTLSFQLKHGFEVLAVVPDYLQLDPESRGYAAIIEWLNPAVATPEDFARQRVRFPKPRGETPAAGKV